MEPSINVLALYAWADNSQAEQRGWWRGLMSYFISFLLEIETDSSDALIAASVARSTEELMEADAQSAVGIIRVISADLCRFMSIPREFGLAAFLETQLPTSFIQTRPAREKPSEDDVVKRWLTILDSLQNDMAFQERCNDWRNELIESLDSEDSCECDGVCDCDDEDEDGEDFEDAEPSSGSGAVRVSGM